MIRAAFLFWVLCVSSAAAQCFIDQEPAPGQTEAFDARMRALIVAHAPIEYRKSCGLLDDSDQRYFEAVRAQASCTESDGYDQFFGRTLSEGADFVFAVRREDLRSDEDFETYCQIVDRIDLSIVIGDDGKVRPDMLQAQVPLFHALRELVLTRSWEN